MKGISKQLEILFDVISKNICSLEGCDNCEHVEDCSLEKNIRKISRKIISKGFLQGFDDPGVIADFIDSYERDGVTEALESCVEEILELYGDNNSDIYTEFHSKDSMKIVATDLFDNKTRLIVKVLFVPSSEDSKDEK